MLDPLVLLDAVFVVHVEQPEQVLQEGLKRVKRKQRKTLVRKKTPQKMSINRNPPHRQSVSQTATADGGPTLISNFDQTHKMLNQTEITEEGHTPRPVSLHRHVARVKSIRADVVWFKIQIKCLPI